MRFFILNIFLGFFLTTSICAKETPLTMDDKIILMLENERKISANKEKLYMQSIANEKKISANKEKLYMQDIENPFRNRDYGLELNIPFLVFSAFPDILMLSGTFSIFNPERKSEIAFPFFIYSATQEWENTSNTKHNFSSIDISYRQFIGKYLNGFYVSAFVRATHIKGILGENFMYEDGEELSGEYGSQNKLGAGLGIGYRAFSTSSFYWGTSISVGRYFTGNHNIFADEMFFEDAKYIFDIEFLKLGYAF